MAYNDIMEYLEEALSDDPAEQMWRFKDIIAHEGHLSLRTQVTRDLSTMFLLYGKTDHACMSPSILLVPTTQSYAPNMLSAMDYSMHRVGNIFEPSRKL